MRKWKVVDPSESGPVERILTEQDILDEYYDWWKLQMEKVGKADQINPATCIDDWVVVHWAEVVDDAG